MTSKYFNRNESVPAISIIMPMFNVDKYVGQCLDSVLAQTFKDYEVMLVNDCSTDRSLEIAESYLDKFDGRLRIHTLTHNSGGASVPRNTAIRMARGKYLYILDSDDVLLPKTLEEFYNAAEEFDADYVHTEKHFISTIGDQISPPYVPLTVRWTDVYDQNGGVTEPTVEQFSFAERVKRYSEGRYHGFVWSKFFRRDMFVKNDLKFPPDVYSFEDAIVVFYCVCCANRIVRIPMLPLIYRILDSSHNHSDISPEKTVHKMARNYAGGMEAITEFMKRNEQFQKQPELKQFMFGFWLRNCTWQPNMTQLYDNTPLHVLHELLLKEFEAINHGYNPDATAYMFSHANLNVRQTIQQRNIIMQLQQQVQTLQNRVRELEQKNQ